MANQRSPIFVEAPSKCSGWRSDGSEGVRPTGSPANSGSVWQDELAAKQIGQERSPKLDECSVQLMTLAPVRTFEDVCTSDILEVLALLHGSPQAAASI